MGDTVTIVFKLTLIDVNGGPIPLMGSRFMSITGKSSDLDALALIAELEVKNKFRSEFPKLQSDFKIFHTCNFYFITLRNVFPGL